MIELLEREPLARHQLGRAEPDRAVGIDRDLDEREHVARWRERQIEDRVAPEVTVLRGIRRLAFPEVELEARLVFGAGREHAMLACRHDRALCDHALALAALH